MFILYIYYPWYSAVIVFVDTMEFHSFYTSNINIFLKYFMYFAVHWVHNFNFNMYTSRLLFRSPILYFIVYYIIIVGTYYL